MKQLHAASPYHRYRQFGFRDVGARAAAAARTIARRLGRHDRNYPAANGLQQLWRRSRCVVQLRRILPPKAVRAAAAIKANPEKSDRAIATGLGVSKDTVRKARSQLASGSQLEDGPRSQLVNSHQLEDGPRTGLDGKTRAPRKRITGAEVYSEAATQGETNKWLRPSQ